MAFLDIEAGTIQFELTLRQQVTCGKFKSPNAMIMSIGFEASETLQ